MKSKSQSLPALVGTRRAPVAAASGARSRPLRSHRQHSDAAQQMNEFFKRRWLQLKGQHSHLDFSNEERTELRQYFTDLAGSHHCTGINPRMPMDRCEDMLISLGVAHTQRDISGILAKHQRHRTKDIGFETFLSIVKSGSGSTRQHLPALGTLRRGGLGDQALSLETNISAHRRGLMLDAIGAGREAISPQPANSRQHQTGTKVMANFARLQRRRHLDAIGGRSSLQASQPLQSRGPEELLWSSQFKSRSTQSLGYEPLPGLGAGELVKPGSPVQRYLTSREKTAKALPFDPIDTTCGHHFGRLREVWQDICQQHHFLEEYVDSPTSSRADASVLTQTNQRPKENDFGSSLEVSISW